MNTFRKTLSFYIKPLLLILVLNLLYWLFAGSYLEEWEGFFSTAIEGIYTHPATRGWDTDTHFLLIYVYHWLAGFSEVHNVYGYILFFHNWSSLTLLGMALYRILCINLKKFSYTGFFLLYSILALNSLQNLNSTRHAFIIAAAVIAFIESYRLEGKRMDAAFLVFLSVITFYACLIRFDSVLLFALVYLVLTLLYRRFALVTLLPLLISGSIYTVYHVISDRYTSDEKKVLLYKEREIFDRYNVAYDRLSALQQLEVDAITQFCITDKEHFTMGFYDSISMHHPGKGILNVLNGFNRSSFYVTWMISKATFFTARYYLLFFLLSGLMALYACWGHLRRFGLHFLFLSIFPVFLCFYTVVPLRFLVPYLSFAACLNGLLFLHYRDRTAPIWGMAFLFLMLFGSEARTDKAQYKAKAATFMRFQDHLLQLERTSGSREPVVLNSVYPVSYFPVDPFAPLYKQHAVFLNFYLFSADAYQIETWKALCGCNTFSLRERVDYVVAHRNLFLIDDAAFAFLQKYFRMKHQTGLVRQDVAVFDEHLKSCRLGYAEK